MNKTLLPALLFLMLGYQTSAAAQTSLVNEHKEQAAILAKDFMGTLKPLLKEAITQKGPVHAIAVCSVEAPKIAQSLGELSGWQIKRVSLKARNPNAKPDEWEAKQLVLFDKLQQQGAKTQSLNAWSLEKKRFRYMQAQTTQGLCLTCHGKNIAPDVKKALANYYPNDKATGYTLGEVRGAISLSKKIE